MLASLHRHCTTITSLFPFPLEAVKMEKQAGVIAVLTKSGEHGLKVSLRTNTPCTFGSSKNSTFRMRDNVDIRGIHCIVNVNSKGFVRIVSS